MCVTQGTLQSSVYCSQHQSYSHAMMTRCALKSKVGLGTIVGLPGSHLKLLQHRKDRNYATSQRSTLTCHRHSTCERGNKIDRPFAPLQSDFGSKAANVFNGKPIFLQNPDRWPC
jgi:hypothetical protein